MATNTKRTNTESIGQIPDLSYSVKDERLPISLTIETPDEEVKFILYFNPADPHIYTHAIALDNLPDIKIDKNSKYEDIAKNMDEFNQYFDYHFDEIFGLGRAREVCRYSGFKQSILSGLMQRVKVGIEYFREQTETERKKNEADNRAELIKQAKAESAAFLSSKK